MLTQEDFTKALEAEVQRAGSQAALAQKVSMTQSQISDYLRGRFHLENMTVGNLLKLFPCTQISLSGERPDEPVARSLEEQLFGIYKNLDPDQKVRCLAIIAAHFPDQVIKNPRG